MRIGCLLFLCCLLSACGDVPEIPIRMGKSTVAPNYKGHLTSMLVVYQAVEGLAYPDEMNDGLKAFSRYLNDEGVDSAYAIQEPGSASLGVIASRYDQQLIIRPVRRVSGEVDMAEFGLVVVDRQETAWVSNVYLPLTPGQPVAHRMSALAPVILNRLRSDGLLAY